VRAEVSSKEYFRKYRASNKVQIAAAEKRYRNKPEAKIKIEATRLKRYAASPGKQQEERRRVAQKRRARFAALMVEIKAAPCMDCGRKFPPVAMDFDHVREEKHFNISMARDKPAYAILEELKKCDLICACCHRVRTERRRDALLG
jgi:hypothetical protein